MLFAQDCMKTPFNIDGIVSVTILSACKTQHIQVNYICAQFIEFVLVVYLFLDASSA